LVVKVSIAAAAAAAAGYFCYYCKDFAAPSNGDASSNQSHQPNCSCCPTAPAQLLLLLPLLLQLWLCCSESDASF
jgi:hypothetical protein